MVYALSFWQQYAIHGQDFLVHTVTSDKTSKCACMEWKHLSFPHSRKFKVMLTVGKMMASVFWEQKDMLFVNFLEREAIINATILMLSSWGTDKRCVASSLCLPTHSRFNSRTLATFSWENVDYPLFSPDLALSDFHLLPALKEHLGSLRLQSDEDVKTMVTQWFYVQDTTFYKMGIKEKCLACHVTTCIVCYIQINFSLEVNILLR